MDENNKNGTVTTSTRKEEPFRWKGTAFVCDLCGVQVADWNDHRKWAYFSGTKLTERTCPNVLERHNPDGTKELIRAAVGGKFSPASDEDEAPRLEVSELLPSKETVPPDYEWTAYGKHSPCDLCNGEFEDWHAHPRFHMRKGNVYARSCPNALQEDVHGSVQTYECGDWTADRSHRLEEGSGAFIIKIPKITEVSINGGPPVPVSNFKTEPEKKKLSCASCLGPQLHRFVRTDNLGYSFWSCVFCGRRTITEPDAEAKAALIEHKALPPYADQLLEAERLRSSQSEALKAEYKATLAKIREKAKDAPIDEVIAATTEAVDAVRANKITVTSKHPGNVCTYPIDPDCACPFCNQARERNAALFELERAFAARARAVDAVRARDRRAEALQAMEYAKRIDFESERARAFDETAELARQKRITEALAFTAFSGPRLSMWESVKLIYCENAPPEHVVKRAGLVFSERMRGEWLRHEAFFSSTVAARWKQEREIDPDRPYDLLKGQSVLLSGWYARCALCGGFARGPQNINLCTLHGEVETFPEDGRCTRCARSRPFRFPPDGAA